MATTGSTPTASGWPYRRAVLAALVVSLALNLFFVAGAAWTRLKPSPHARTVEHRPQRLAAELSLDEKQRTAFDQYLAAMRGRSEKLQQQLAPLHAAGWEEAAKPQADSAAVLRLFDEAFEKRRQSQHEGMVQTLDFLTVLSPEQRAKFAAWVRERRTGLRNPSPTNR